MTEKTYEQKLADEKKKAEIMAIKDTQLRQQGIKENMHLFEEGGQQ